MFDYFNIVGSHIITGMEGYDCNFTASKQENIMDADDRISQLPDTILSHIFTFLNVKDALRTRLLSHRWRYLCVPVSNLVFDHTLINGLYDEDEQDEFIDYSILSSFCYEFVKSVDQFLNIITVQKPITLKICFPLRQEFASHINDWIRLAVDMECEEIELHLDWATEPRDLTTNSEPYNFPCHLLLSCGKSYLKDLSLRECIFKPPLEVANGLNSLTSLRLDGVIVEASDLEIILSGCLNLEQLGLVNCALLSTICICGQDLTLKCLTVISLSIVEKIELSAPNLEKFEYEGRLPNFAVSRLHQLKKIVLGIYEITERGLNQMLDELSRNVPNLQKLSLYGHSTQYGQYLTYTSIYDHTPMFENLTHLVLAVRQGYGWNMFTYLLYRSPRLEVLVLNKCHTRYGEPSWIPPQLVPTCVSSCLKKVCFERFYGHDDELRFAGYILKNASVLETMAIRITTSCGELKRHITNKVKAFSRSSEECQVLFDDRSFAGPDAAFGY